MNRIVGNLSTHCPTEADLRAFSAGRLPDAQLVELADHVASCAGCQSLLETLSDQADTVVAALHELDRWGPLFNEPEFKQLHALARSLDIKELCPPSGVERAIPQVEVSGSAETPLHPSWDAADTQSSGDKAKSSGKRDETPEKIDRYFVLRKIGGGGFGQVYLAKDPESNRKVAIKVPRRDKLTSEESIERFLKEARTAADLAHPAIVQVYDWGRQDDGSCFVVMEYIEGQSLKEMLKTERLGRQQAAEMIAQIAEGLHEAHQREIYHRDVKPANILIDKEGNPHIADFGLAIHEADRWSHKDELAGTFAYMSPEQVRGKAHQLDGRTDIWGLGVIFYETLTRHRAFFGADHEQLFEDILHKEPRPPRMIDATIPEMYERVCLKCLSKHVSERYTTAADIAAVLREGAACGNKPSGPASRDSHGEQPDASAPSANLVSGSLPRRLVRTRKVGRKLALATTIVFGFLAVALALSLPTLSSWLRPSTDDWITIPVDEAEVWICRDPNDNAGVVPHSSRQEIRIDSAGRVLVAFGSTQETWMDFGGSTFGYRLRVTIQQNNPTGESGIFFGGRKEGQRQDGRDVFKYESVALGKSRSAFEFPLRHKSEEVWSPPPFFGGRVGVPEIVRMDRGEHILEVTVMKTGLAEVRWDGRTYRNLVPPDKSIQTEGLFGVIGDRGSTVFRNFQVKPVTKEARE